MPISRRAFLVGSGLALAATVAGDSVLSRRLLMARGGGGAALLTGGSDVTDLFSALRRRQAFNKKLTGPSSGAEVDILNIASGSGVVNWIWCVVAYVSGSGYPDYDHRLRIYTDGSSTPDVDSDLGLLFGFANGTSFGAGSIASEYFAARHKGSSRGPGGQMRLPVYFSNGIRIAVANTTAAAAGQIFSQVDYALSTDNPTLVIQPYRLHSDGVPVAAATAGPSAATTSFPLHSISGNGILVAHSMSAQSSTGLTYMERNIALTIDGEGSPSIESSGTEDWFTGSYYWLAGETPYSRKGAMGLGAISTSPYLFSALLDVAGLVGGLTFASSLSMTWEKNADVADGCSAYGDQILYYLHT